jgi:hypothetical protein
MYLGGNEAPRPDGFTIPSRAAKFVKFVKRSLATCGSWDRRNFGAGGQNRMEFAMKARNFISAGAALVAVVASAGQARADTFQVFDVSGTYTFFFGAIPPSSAFSGTITVDITTAVISNAALTLQGSGTTGPFWTVIVGQSPDAISPFYDVTIETTRFNAGTFDNGTSSCGGFSPGGCHDKLFLVLSNNPLALVAGQGGLIVSGNSLLYDAGISITSVNGTLTPASAVPAPAALPLFATGLGALGLLAWRRKQKTPRRPVKH